MSSAKIKLTQKRVNEAKPAAGKAETALWDADVSGLCLRIRASGAKSWRVVDYVAGKQVKITLGDASRVDLDTARRLAKAATAKAAAGVDPRLERKELQDRDKRSVSAVIDAYDEDLKARNVSERHRTNTISVLKRGMSRVASRDIGTLTRQECVGLVTAIKSAGARQSFRQRLTPLLNYAVNEGLASANVMAGWRAPRRSKTEMLAKPGRILTADEIRAIWTSGDGVFGDAIRTLILTGLRKTEALSMERSWIDEKLGAIIVPQDRMKNGKAHAVPLTPVLRSILEARPKWATSDLFFPTRTRNRSGGILLGIGQMKDRLQRLSGTADWTVHDLRRTFRSMLSDLGFDEDLCERMIAHSRDALVERYDRSSRWPERVAAAEALERHVIAIVEGGCGANVVPLRA